MFVNLDGFYFQFMFRPILEPSPSFMRSRGSAWQASACWCGKWRPGINVTQHRFNFIFPSGSFSLANAAHSPQALPFAEANGKHIRHRR